ncbi:unnamed protein product, partial [Choristocarpus tenellus]
QCWGKNTSGQLGLGHIETIGDDPREMGDYLQPVDLGQNKLQSAVAISAGSSHSCALLADASLRCWGRNFYGNLGIETFRSVGHSRSAPTALAPAVDLGLELEALAISAGGESSCAVLNDGNAKCWGKNLGGELGVGDTYNRGDDAMEMGDYLLTVDLGTNVAVSATGG